ncbi:MAG TPA: tyrosine--tRNA ligase [Candidatus Omnitrophica bacterium]|nr:MAG: tyrosine--tRNA ligase [Omnitrophica WOR_2 bacterium GWA2_53_43]HBO97312.1 tyrosine--tRNA ligase [Candidatus Omnitrophota bacterium]HCI44862.1 tyrosine--tRNA ligase [Candidatus Omnitrophota bacterium]
MAINESLEHISRGTAEIINPEGLKAKLLASQKSKKPLRVKAGFDPTAPDIHLGHTVLLRKLRQLQDLGHQVFFLIGDFTAQIGDPTGKDQIRPQLDRQKINQNAKTYKEQVFKILDPKRTEVVFNSAWLDKLSSQEVLSLTAHSTVAQMLARSDFKKRFEEKKEISLLEFVYPLLQGYDSVHLKADIELGGSDQKFNLLMGRQLQEAYGQEPQAIIMTPLLEGTDGVNKMSKTLNNYIGINESADEAFGKIMSISDDLMYRYYETLTDLDMAQIRALHPKEAKMKLAGEIIARFHDSEKAEQARKNFEKVFTRGQTPENVPEYRLGPGTTSLVDILLLEKLVDSRREFQRLLSQGAISHNNHAIRDAHWRPQGGIIKVGKRRFLKLI